MAHRKLNVEVEDEDFEDGEGNLVSNQPGHSPAEIEAIVNARISEVKNLLTR